MVRDCRSVLRQFGAFTALLLASTVCSHGLDAAKSDAPKPAGPSDAKAQKTYANAVEWQKRGAKAAAIDDFRKANKQDGGHCPDCLRQAYGLAVSIGDYKAAADIAREWIAMAQTDTDRAAGHYRIAVALQQEGLGSKKDKCFEESCDEFRTALQLQPKLTPAHYSLGLSLAHLHQDDEARAHFSTFLEQDKQNPGMHERATRYVERIELARAKMAPPFSVTTLDGKSITMDSLAGKVVLIDFWATWCGPCREALPHIREIARRFQGQPLVVLSVSLDKDANKWKEFVNKNGMTWMQYRDGSFDGNLSKMFAVTAIPATFTIDADGVLEDQHVGDANIEGKLKKLVARAAEVANRKPTTEVVENSEGKVN